MSAPKSESESEPEVYLYGLEKDFSIYLHKL